MVRFRRIVAPRRCSSCHQLRRASIPLHQDDGTAHGPMEWTVQTVFGGIETPLGSGKGDKNEAGRRGGPLPGEVRTWTVLGGMDAHPAGATASGGRRGKGTALQCWRRNGRHAKDRKSIGRGSMAACSTSRNLAGVQTPHSGYHFDGTDRRFFEGWYFRVTMPESGESFALIYSVEDPLGNTPISGVGAQVMGPRNGYFVQYDKRTADFWAQRNKLALGCNFKAMDGIQKKRYTDMVGEDQFRREVKEGFQSGTYQHQGRLVATDVNKALGKFSNPYLEAMQRPAVSTVPSCSWSFSTKPVYGWGDPSSQRATAGWLAALPAFEPHWQIMMAHGVSSGWFQWGDERFEFQDAPTYAEKNWGGSFPQKWFWIQCNSFDGHPDLTLTAGGGTRELPILPGSPEEDVAMIGVHCDGQFYEFVPWNGEVDWVVSPWGTWVMHGVNEGFEVFVEGTAVPEDGVVLRAPTLKNGLVPFCKDTFSGQIRLKLVNRRSSQTVIEAGSNTGGLEVGGGPWWDTWAAKAAMKEPLRSLVKLPIDVGKAIDFVPEGLKPFVAPPGL